MLPRPFIRSSATSRRCGAAAGSPRASCRDRPAGHSPYSARSIRGIRHGREALDRIAALVRRDLAHAAHRAFEVASADCKVLRIGEEALAALFAGKDHAEQAIDGARLGLLEHTRDDEVVLEVALIA